jgi:uncharacterized protein
LKVAVDTGPLLAAADVRDPAHRLAAALVTELGRDLLVPEPVVVEVDHLLRKHVSVHSARLFLEALADGVHEIAFPSRNLLRRATEIDAVFGDLDLGYVDASVMAVAEHYNLPVLTFDFGDFRATRPRDGYWRLVIDERQYAEATS